MVFDWVRYNADMNIFVLILHLKAHYRFLTPMSYLPTRG